MTKNESLDADITDTPFFISEMVAEQSLGKLQKIEQKNDDLYDNYSLCLNFSEFSQTLQDYFDGIPQSKNNLLLLTEYHTKQICNTFNKFFWKIFYNKSTDVLYHHKIPNKQKLQITNIHSNPENWIRIPNARKLFENDMQKKYLEDILCYEELTDDSLAALRGEMLNYLNSAKFLTNNPKNKSFLNVEIKIDHIKHWVEEIKINIIKNIRIEFLEFCELHKDTKKTYLWDFEKDEPSSYNWLREVSGCDDNYYTRWLSAHIIYILTTKMIGKECNLLYANEYQIMLILRGRGDIGKTPFLKILCYQLIGDMGGLLDKSTSPINKILAVRNCLIALDDELKSFKDADGNDLKNLISTDRMSAVKKFKESKINLECNHIYVGTTNDATFIPLSALEKRFMILDLDRDFNYDKLIEILPLLYAEAYNNIKKYRDYEELKSNDYHTKFETILTKYKGNKPKDFRKLIDTPVIAAMQGGSRYTPTLIPFLQNVEKTAYEKILDKQNVLPNEDEEGIDYEKLPQGDIRVTINHSRIMSCLLENSDFKYTGATENVLKMYLVSFYGYKINEDTIRGCKEYIKIFLASDAK